MDNEDTDPHSRFPKRRANGQFRKGFSGNRKGRPRKARSTKAVFQEMLASKVLMTVDGRPRMMSVTEAMAARVKLEALTGTLRGLERGVAVAQRYSLEDPTPEEMPADYSVLTEEELETFGKLLSKVLGEPEPVRPKSPFDDYRRQMAEEELEAAATERAIIPSRGEEL